MVGVKKGGDTMEIICAAIAIVSWAGIFTCIAIVAVRNGDER
jgi:hypothetical protein